MEGWISTEVYFSYKRPYSPSKKASLLIFKEETLFLEPVFCSLMIEFFTILQKPTLQDSRYHYLFTEGARLNVVRFLHKADYPANEASSISIAAPLVFFSAIRFPMVTGS